MNWYKQSAPIDESSNMGYLEIAHPTYVSKNAPKPNYEIWMIDKNFKFYSKKAEKPYEGHHGWKERYKIIEEHGGLASGRYDVDNHIASMGFVFSTDVSRCEYIKKRTAQILDYQYGNPKIISFDNCY